jgi:hypothetical protein
MGWVDIFLFTPLKLSVEQLKDLKIKISYIFVNE